MDTKILRKCLLAGLAAVAWALFIYALAAFVAAEFDFRVWESTSRFVVVEFVMLGSLVAAGVALSKS